MMSTSSNITEGPPNGAAMAKRSKSVPARGRTVAPLHPGRVLGGMLAERRTSVRAAASKMGISHNALANVIKGASAVSAEMALRLGKLCGNGPEIWLNLQQAHDLWHAEAKLRAELEAIEALDAA